jgi:hypothetical protein
VVVVRVTDTTFEFECECEEVEAGDVELEGETRLGGKDAARVCNATGPGNMNLSAIEEGCGGGGDIGRDVRIGRLPSGDVPIPIPAPIPLPLPASVGVNSGPPSNPSSKNRLDKTLSISSRWKFGVVRYRAVSVSVPIGWGIDGNVCVVVGRGGWVRVGGVSVSLRAARGRGVSINIRGGINIQRGLTET